MGRLSMTITNKYQLKRHIHYNQFTGVFTRIQQPLTGPDRIGEIANKELLGNGKIQILQEKYMATHLAYLYVTGMVPDGRISHIDGDHSNFKWDNLLLAKRTYQGDGNITWVSKNQRYQAYIGKKYLGLFKTVEGAVAALDVAQPSSGMTREQAAQRLKDAGITGVEARRIFEALN